MQLFDENGKSKNKKIGNSAWREEKHVSKGRADLDLLVAEKALLNAIAALIQPQCGGEPPALNMASSKDEKVAVKASSKGNERPPVNNKNAASRLLQKKRRVSTRVQAKDRIKGSRPPAYSGRYPIHSPGREAGLLNADLGGMMGGLQGMGPLGAMMGQMGLGGDDDEDGEEEERKRKEEEEKSKKKDPMQQLSRRQRKRVVRVGR